MKRFPMILLALAAAFALTACQGSAESDYSQPLETPGVASYELSGEAAYVVNAYGLSTNSWIYRFRSPEGAKGFNVNAYTLSETGEWVETGIGGLFFDEPQPEGGFSGVFTLPAALAAERGAVGRNPFFGRHYGIGNGRRKQRLLRGGRRALFDSAERRNPA